MVGVEVAVVVGVEVGVLDASRAGKPQPGALINRRNTEKIRMTRDELIQLHEQHRLAQANLADANERYGDARIPFQEEMDRQWKASNAELIAERDEATQKAIEIEAQLRQGILAAYDADPTTKTFAPGLGVMVREKLVYDPGKALEWAKEHGLALALDTKAFEAIAKVQKLDFVTTEDAVSAKIGK